MLSISHTCILKTIYVLYKSERAQGYLYLVCFCPFDLPTICNQYVMGYRRKSYLNLLLWIGASNYHTTLCCVCILINISRYSARVLLLSIPCYSLSVFLSTIPHYSVDVFLPTRPHYSVRVFLSSLQHNSVYVFLPTMPHYSLWKFLSIIAVSFKPEQSSNRAFRRGNGNTTWSLDLKCHALRTWIASTTNNH